MDEALQQSTPEGRFKGVLSTVGYAIKEALGGSKGLGFVTLRQLADLAKDKLPVVERYVDTVHRMITRRNQMSFEAAEIAQDIRKWAAKNQKAADEMFGIAHEATVHGVDPDKDFVSLVKAAERRIDYIKNIAQGHKMTTEQRNEIKELTADIANEPRRRRKHAALKRKFDKLPEEAKKHYRTMRDNYKQRHDQYIELLVKQIENADIDGGVKRKRIAELRSLYEIQEVTAPYFPLARFGNYHITAIDENGEKRFMMFETEKQQQDVLRSLRQQGFEAKPGYKFDDSTGLQGAGIGFVSDLMGKIDDTSLSDIKKEELKDTIYQMYLNALPSRSMRKQYIHRKKTQGWSNDALRALATNMMKSAYQLARLEYSDELTKNAAEAKKIADESGSNQAGRYAEELMKRHEWVMNPTHSKIAQD